MCIWEFRKHSDEQGRSRRIALLLDAAGRALAQELEPGAYWPIPTGLNIVTVVNSFNWGDVAFDPAAPIDEASGHDQHDGVLVHSRVRAGRTIGQCRRRRAGRHRSCRRPVSRRSRGGRSLRPGRSAISPGDEPVRRARDDTQVVRVVSAADHRRHQRHRGTAVRRVRFDEVINLGTNRWSFKPEIGFSRTSGHWVVEAMAGVWLFTDNDDFVGGRTREQDPIAAMQVHLTYKFKRTVWLAGDANYFTGGRSTIGGKQNIDLQRNSRVGATFSSAIGPSQAIRVSVSTGRVHHDRRRVHVDCHRLQLRMGSMRQCLPSVVVLLTALTAAACGSRETDDGAIPPTASPYDALPEAARLALDKPFTGDFDEMVKRRADSRRRDVQPHSLLRRPGAGARTDLRVLKAVRERSQHRAEDGQPQGARGDRADVARSAVSRARQRQGRHGRGDGDRQAGTGEARRLLRADPHQRERGGGDRSWGADDRTRLTISPARRCSSARASVYYETLIAAEQAAEGARQAARRHRRSPRRARRRRRARDGQRRPRADHGRRRLSRRVLEPGVHRSHGPPRRRRAHRRHAGGRLSQGQPASCCEAVNAWIRKHGKGDAFRNVIERRYLAERQVREERRCPMRSAGSFRRSSSCSRKYGKQYDLDYLLMAAQGYQESTLDQNVKSPVGAIGVMQVMPPTGRQTERRRHPPARTEHPRRREVHAVHDGPRTSRTSRWTTLNKGLMTFASYNAGPGRCDSCGARREKRGPQSQRLVRQCRAHRLGTDRPRDGHLRQQHLQVLRRVSPTERSGRASCCGKGRSWAE